MGCYSALEYMYASFACIATLFIGCNTLPMIDPNIEGIPERLTVFPADATFTDHGSPDAMHQRAAGCRRH